ncbi:MAG: hypothetical protein WA211_20965 [Candidatus Acidiferrales bacterium]
MKTATGAPLGAFAGTEAFAIELFGHFADGDVLDDQLHHGEQEFHLAGIFLEALAGAESPSHTGLPCFEAHKQFFSPVSGQQ